MVHTHEMYEAYMCLVWSIPTACTGRYGASSARQCTGMAGAMVCVLDGKLPGKGQNKGLASQPTQSLLYKNIMKFNCEQSEFSTELCCKGRMFSPAVQYLKMMFLS